ncbi:hypothetical protein R3I93_020282 [Phoxinus phoxinus]|uniref:Uncharacterized protein n=1 Tax=Phoxinus phoxinus TaxID=58324 RepID=A0AAN9CBU3_9TELE
MPTLELQNCKMKLNLYGKQDSEDHQKKRRDVKAGQCFCRKVIRKGQDLLDNSQAFNTPGGNDCVTFNSNGQRACGQVATWRKRMSRMSLRRRIGF